MNSDGGSVEEEKEGSKQWRFHPESFYTDLIKGMILN